MKHCPSCNQTYTDESLKFCRIDGTLLQDISSLQGDSTSTLPFKSRSTSEDQPTQIFQDEGLTRRTLEQPKRQPRIRGTTLITIFSVFALAVSAIGTWIHKSSESKPKPPGISLQNAKFTRLTTSGKVTGVSMSPDGRYVAHVIEDAGQESLWVRQTATSSNVQIVPPSDATFRGFSFSPDGNYVYYATFGSTNLRGVLYQVPVLGGTARKILTGIHSAVTFSPTGKQIAFIRRSAVDGGRDDLLMVANADGSQEKRLAAAGKNKRLYRSNFTSISWSPDGKTIACPFGDFIQNHMGVATVSVDTGELKLLTPENWFAVRQVAWLGDGSHILFNAQERSAGTPLQIWQVAYPSGQIQRVTNDLNEYRMFDVTPKSDALAVVEGQAIANISVMPINDSTRARQITSDRNINGFLTWTPDNQLIYHSTASGGVDLYAVNPQGGNPKQLTANTNSNVYPTVSPNGRYVVFMSDRTGVPHIWRMDPDGNNPKQLTDGFDLFPHVSPDGQWIVYQTWNGESMLQKVSIDGGAAVQLTDYRSSKPAFSRDGKHIALTYQEDIGAPVQLAVIGAEGGRPLKIFPVTIDPDTNLRWTNDDRAILFAQTSKGVSNLWAQPVAGGPPKQITNFTSERMIWFDLSQDGKQLAISRGIRMGDVVLINSVR